MFTNPKKKILKLMMRNQNENKLKEILRNVWVNDLENLSLVNMCFVFTK